MSNNEIYLAIGVMAIANFLTRVFPFIFYSKKEPPKFISYIAMNFPPTIMTILIFYTLVKVDFSHAPYGLIEILSIFITILLHLRFNNYLISIFLGTITYMVLVQNIVF